MLPIDIPSNYEFLFEKARYKVCYGGRGGAKSHSIARALLIRGMQKEERVICVRETQKNLATSVYQLLRDLIVMYELEDFYTIRRDWIDGINGTKFIFMGMRYDPNAIKSLEGATICWVEEAQAISKASWDVLKPTVRKPGSEIWVSFNPLLETDETYKQFILYPPKNAIIHRINWNDLDPMYVSKEMREEIEHVRSISEDEYLHIYEGHCRQVLEGAIFANEIRDCIRQGRICTFEVDRRIPCYSAWDLGFSDMNSIWVWQVVGREIRIVSFYQARFEELDHYVQWLHDTRLHFETHYLPHDANQGQLSAGGKSVFNQLREKCLPVKVLPMFPLKSGLAYCREIFPRVVFNAMGCYQGIECLKKYRYKVDLYGNYSNNPKHDDASHGADAFRLLALAVSNVTREELEDKRTNMLKQYRRQYGRA